MEESKERSRAIAKKIMLDFEREEAKKDKETWGKPFEERMEVLGRRAEKASEDFDKLVEKYGPDLTVDEYLKKTSMD